MATCYRCGRPGHYANRCNANTSVVEDVCHRCGRSGHWESQCYARTMVNNEGVYALKNSQGQVYVGQSVDIARRLDQHRSGTGAAFTSETEGWRRVRTVTTATTTSASGYTRENLETLIQTAIHGTDKVRGGSFTKREESKHDLAVRARMMEKEGIARATKSTR